MKGELARKSWADMGIFFRLSPVRDVSLAWNRTRARRTLTPQAQPAAGALLPVSSWEELVGNGWLLEVGDGLGQGVLRGAWIRPWYVGAAPGLQHAAP